MNDYDLDAEEIHDLTVTYGTKFQHDQNYPNCHQEHIYQIEATLTKQVKIKESEK